MKVGSWMAQGEVGAKKRLAGGGAAAVSWQTVGLWRAGSRVPCNGAVRVVAGGHGACLWLRWTTK